MVLERERAVAFAGCREDRVEHRGRRHADRRLADAAPETSGRHDDAFDLRHLRNSHAVVGVEVGLFNRSVLDRAFAEEQRR